MAQLQEDKYNLSAKRFNMWIFIFASFMLFAAFTSGFIVYVGGKSHGLNLILPAAFRYSTFIILLSSATMFLAARAAKQSEVATQRALLWVTMALGIAFFAMQIYGWYVMSYQLANARLVNTNAAITFVYVLTGSHLLHIFAGLIILMRALVSSYKKEPQALNLHKMKMSSIFWHFLDIIWIYLYVFLLLNQY